MPDFTQLQKKLLSRFAQEANQALDNQRQNLVTEVTSEVRGRDWQAYELRTELSLQELHQENVTQHQCQEYVCLHQHLIGFVQETQQYREMFEETAISATGPAIERLRQKQNFYEKYVFKIVPWQNLMLFSFRRNRTHLESHESRTSEDQLVVRDLRSEVTQSKASAVASNLARNLEAKIVSQKHEIQSLQKRHTDNTRFAEQLGRSKAQFGSRCLR